MFQKYQPKKPPLNPFEEAEEDNYTSPTSEKPDDLNPFKDDLEKDINTNAVSTNPFEDSTGLDETNPFSEKFENDSYSSLEKKKSAPVPPKSKSQTLPQNSLFSESPQKSTNKTDLHKEMKGGEKTHRYQKSPKKKAPTPPRPVYEGTPPPSPKEQRKSRPLTPPNEKGDASVPSTPSSG